MLRGEPGDAHAFEVVQPARRRDGDALQGRITIVRDGYTLVSTLELDPPGDELPFGATRRALRRTGAR